MYGMTLSFTEKAIMVKAWFFWICRAATSTTSVGASVPAGTDVCTSPCCRSAARQGIPSEWQLSHTSMTRGPAPCYQQEETYHNMHHAEPLMHLPTLVSLSSIF